MSDNTIITTQNKTNPMAIVSLVAGLLGFCLPIIASITAIITGLMARKQIKDSDGAFTGEGLAYAGLGLGIFQIIFYACAACLSIIWFIALQPNLSSTF